eukprot:CAMPEP_0202858840 /NCGR_PEP_ID=MMETSP1391-20130828/1200_1 /ASSEMBLY_ACC=CAM_ASM_000867 /TAXON_ID=1034604 /ORGANISM="Chlamydomonas leiostraca, Strain SAG 11-49" /LENGTH=137 /DNA_ID=CAMNT_0049537803 /DNA_START=78 /DNA_END=488 /DNA_ORIENTATION=+
MQPYYLGKRCYRANLSCARQLCLVAHAQAPPHAYLQLANVQPWCAAKRPRAHAALSAACKSARGQLLMLVDAAPPPQQPPRWGTPAALFAAVLGVWWLSSHVRKRKEQQPPASSSLHASMLPGTAAAADAPAASAEQ